MPTLPRISSRNPTLWLALAGLTIAGLAIVYFLTRSHEASGGRTNEDMLVVPRDGSTITSVHTRFRWRRNPLSNAYSFLLYKVDRTLVWSALVRDTSLAVPTSVELQRGNTYLWRIEAIMQDETTIRSELHAFTLSQ